MKNKFFILIVLSVLIVIFASFSKEEYYTQTFENRFERFREQEVELLKLLTVSDLSSKKDIAKIKEQIDTARVHLKGVDFWLRYFGPQYYRLINGPLPFEWENNLHNKKEPPRHEEGAGVTLMEMALNQPDVDKAELVGLMRTSLNAISKYEETYGTECLITPDHFYFCNRLFLLNLSSIYTTGFDCPDTSRVLPELQSMMLGTKEIYLAYNNSFPDKQLSSEYLHLYSEAISFVLKGGGEYSDFDHFSFIRKYVNPLFKINQKLIREYGMTSNNDIDFTISKDCNSIFSKDLFVAQNTRGIYDKVKDKHALQLIDQVGKTLFYDPILSGNNKRSCVSCHKPNQFFTDTISATSPQFNEIGFLARNTPSLINSQYNHLIMLDGAHSTLQDQAVAVITNPIEMRGDAKIALKKVLNCDAYREKFTTILKYTPNQKEITIDHITSAIVLYYSKFSKYYSRFDNAINYNEGDVDEHMRQGFNLFMGKAKCGTCHFVPQFNGVKPPFVSSEFEVIGVPSDVTFKQVSSDKGRFNINAADDTRNAFRTSTIRNVQFTKPYMHNGVFSTLNEVLDFYNAGGGVGRKIDLNNQTLPPDSLKLSKNEVGNIIAFINSLSENVQFDAPPKVLPKSKITSLNQRKIGGEY